MALGTGSSIEIVNPFLSCGQYKVGDVLTLERVDGAVVYAMGIDMAIGHDEYVPLKRGELNGLSKLPRISNTFGSRNRVG